MAQAAENVLLGILDEKIYTQTSFYTNKVGGRPDFFEGSSADLQILCKRCERSQVLISQIYCPLDGSDQHRLLYIFACTDASCWNQHSSWTAIRFQARDQSYTASSRDKTNPTVLTTADLSTEKSTNNKPSVDDWGMGASDWGATNDWGGGGDEWDSTNDHLGQDEFGQIAPSLDDKNSYIGHTIDTTETKESSQNAVIKDLNVESTCPNHHSNEGRSCTENKREPSTQSPRISENTETTPDNCRAEISDIDLKNASIISYLNISEETTSKTCDSKESKDRTTPLKSYYINVFDEPLNAEEENFKHEQKLIREYAKTNNMNFEDFEDSSRKSSKEGYEKASVKHDDKTFHHFMKRISRCPEQILRYQYDGEPLPVRKLTKDDVIPTCSNCGSPRIFELQLMPSLVGYLRYPQFNNIVVEFGAVMVYTCKQNCQPNTANTGVTEYVIVQSDPDQHLFKT